MKTFGEYNLNGELGRGATGVVYRATRADQAFALKVLTSTGDGVDGQLRFRREAAALSRLNHPGVVRILEAGEAEGKSYLVMELVDGESLEQRLTRGRLPAARALALLKSLARALTEVHRHGLVHRDVKPANVIIDDADLPKLIDFGFAGEVRTDDGLLGTMLYAAPEVISPTPQPVDARVDLYSLGVIAYEALTGRTPFIGADLTALMEARARGDFPPVRKLNGEVSPPLEAIVHKLLAADADDRYQSAEGLLADLDDLDGVSERFAALGARALGQRDLRRISQQAVPLVGRERELNLVAQCWKNAISTAGGAVLIEGEPGSGKTRLAREALQQLTGTPLVLTGRCNEADRLPFGPLREAIDEQLSRLLRLDEVAREAALTPLRNAAGNDRGLVARLSRGLERVLKLDDGARAESSPEAFYDAQARFLSSWARSAGGLVLWLDDVQWVDAATTAVLARLVEYLEGSPLLLLFTARSDQASQAARERLVKLLGPSLRHHFRLRPLDEEQVRRLIDAVLHPNALDAAFSARVAARSEGSPFVIGQYIRALQDQQVLRLEGDSWVLDQARFEKLELPSDVLGLMLQRLGTLRPQTLEVLATAAAIGMTFRAALVSAASKISAREVSLAIEEAMQASLVEPDTQGAFAFVHSRIRDATLASRTAAGRQDIHQAIADALEASAPEDVFALAHHCLQGYPERSPQRTMTACLAAGTKALATYSDEDAWNLLREAHRAAVLFRPDDEGGIALSEPLGLACIRTGRVGDALVHLQRALAATKTPLEAGRIYAHLARAHSARMHFDDTWRTCQQGLRVLGAPFPQSRVAQALGTLWELAVLLVLSLTGWRYGAAKGDELARRKILSSLYGMSSFIALIGMRVGLLRQLYPRLYRQVHFMGEVRESIEPLASFALVLSSLGLMKPALKQGFKAQRIAEDLGERGLVAVVRRNIAMVHNVCGDPVRAQAMERELFHDWGRWLAPREFITACSDLGINLMLRGYMSESVEVFRGGYQLAEERGLTSGNANHRALAGAGQAMLGDLSNAQKNNAECNRLSKTIPDDHWVRIVVAGANVLYCLETGELGAPLEAAIASFESAGVKPKDVTFHLKPYFVYATLARLAQLERASAADRPAATERLRKITDDLFTTARTAPFLVFGHVARAALHRVAGEFKEASAQLELATQKEVAVDSPWARYEIARERAWLARAQGQRDEAEASFRAAYALCLQFGWRARARWFETELGYKATETELATTAGSAGLSSEYLEALLKVALASSTALDPTEQSRAALDAIVQVLGADRAFLFFARGETFDFQAGRDAAQNDLPAATGYSSTVVKQVLQTREPLVVTGTEEGALLGSASAVANELRSIVAVPLIHRQTLLGAIYLDNRMLKGLFTRDHVRILTAIANHVAIAVETARAARTEAARREMERDLELAATVQQFYLPKDLSHRNGALALKGFYRPAQQCSGDWWWYHDDGLSLSVAVGDVTGHGIASAMVVGSVASSFRMMAGLRQPLTRDAFARVDQDIRTLTGGQYLMTMLSVRVDPTTGGGTCLSAGAPAAIWRRANGAIEPVMLQGKPLGSDQLSVAEAPIQFAAGDRLLLYTDGLSEARMPDGSQLRLKRLAKFFAGLGDLPLDQAHQSFVDQLDKALAGTLPDDDLTFVMMEWKP